MEGLNIAGKLKQDKSIYFKMKENDYIGNLKIQQTQYGNIYKSVFSYEDLVELVQRMKANNEKLITIDFKEKRKPSEKGFTHYGMINTYKKQEDNNWP